MFISLFLLSVYAMLYAFNFQSVMKIFLILTFFNTFYLYIRYILYIFVAC